MGSLITNIKLKYDTLANWTREDMEGKGAFLVLQRGEVGFCEVPSNIEGVLPTILFKVGDGNSTFSELNWVSALASDVRPWAKAENKPEYSAAEINGLSEYITQAVKDTNTEYRFNKVNDYEYEFQSKEIGSTEWNVDFTLTIPKYDGTPAFKPTGKSYLTFSSPSSFTLAVGDATKHWNGTLEYFSSDKIWTTWDGTTTLSSVDNDGEHVLYLRGTGNTVITGNSSNYKWVLTGSDVVCSGNIENLLDYVTVESGAHPTMANFCYAYMFQDCTSLTQAPTLPVTTLAEFCYFCMFDGCSGLTQAPALPATTMARYCYGNMFSGCTSLTQAPALPATTLAEYCYQGMFLDCTSLTQAPALPATTLANYCYSYMFQSCKSLTQAPALPATTLAEYCYQKMFLDCTSLTQAPALPATTLANYCYSYMFQSCKSLTQAPALPATTLAEYCYREMFEGCTSLNQAPALPATTLAKNCYYEMFRSCTSLTQAPALPATTLANYCYREMFLDCTSLKLSSTQTGEYMQEYRIPSSGTGITVSYALTDMFASTGGTFTGTPKINTTYYLSTDNMIVRKTEVATLNGYVGSMIDASGGGLPEGATAYQQLVTDGDGNVKWEDRLAYTEQSYAVVYDIASSPSLYVNGTDSAFIKDGVSYVAITDLQTPASLYELKVGDICRINYDDDVYECVVRTHQEEMFNLGNQKFFGGEDTGEPFYIMWGMTDTTIAVPGEYNGHNVSSSTYNLHGLKIEMASEIVVPIDPKWLPAALPNPNALTFTGAVTGSYDGSAPLEVKIPTVDDVLAALPNGDEVSY